VTAHVIAIALISARLLPVAFLCPLFGGTHAPSHVKLGLVLALAGFIHGACGIEAPVVSSAIELAVLGVKEVVFGLALGLVASLPFDVARMGGRFIDLFRGSSAEAALPMSGTKEAATGDALYHLLLALGAAAGLMPLLLGALIRSYAIVSLGAAQTSDSLALHLVGLVGAAFSTGLAIGAPIAALSLAIDAFLGLASRAAPNMNLQETGAPLRILGGGAVLWLMVGLVAARLQDFGTAQADALDTVSRLGLGG
jgi:flagellar biosynthetic protein FliR/type III secretion protein T